MGSTALGNEVTHSSHKQAPAHVRECEQEKATTSKGIYRPDSWEGKDEVDKSKSEGCKKRGLQISSRFKEDGR